MAVSPILGKDIPYDGQQNVVTTIAEFLLALESAFTPGGTRWAASVYHNANQSIPAAAWTTLAFNSESVDTAVMHDNSTNNSRITIKKAGVYVGFGVIPFAGSGAGSVRAGRAIQNGVAVVGNEQGPPVSGTINTVLVVPIPPSIYALNDYVQLQAYQDSGGSLNALYDAANGYFCKLSLWAL